MSTTKPKARDVGSELTPATPAGRSTTQLARVAIERFDEYVIVAKIGQGGMAEVFLALSQGPGTFRKLLVVKRLHAHMIATMSGDVKRSYGLFLGLAADEAARSRLRDQLLFLGLIDLQDTVMGRKARNTGHKALRARAVVDLAGHIGWDRAHGVFYTGVPDMAVGPLYYSLYDAACVIVTEAFPPDAGKSLKQANQTP